MERLEVTVTKKPKRQADPQAVDVDALIRKGGSGAGEGGAENQGQPAKTTSVILRVPAGVMERVDVAVKARRVKTSRHTWLLEAIMEKLDRESQDIN